MSKSDEIGQDEQTAKWGDPISLERQAALQGCLDRWKVETDHGERKGPLAISTIPGRPIRA